jgi:hypothetical protein
MPIDLLRDQTMHTTTVDRHTICYHPYVDAASWERAIQVPCPCCQPAETPGNAQAAWVDTYAAAVSPHDRSDGVLYELLCSSAAHGTILGAEPAYSIRPGLLVWQGAA